MNTYLAIVFGLLVILPLWRGIRIVLTRTVHHFQSYDDITKPYSQRYREGAERLTSGKYIGRYEGASYGKQAAKLGWQLVGLGLISLFGWILIILDVTTNWLGSSDELGTLGAIGIVLIFLSLSVMSVVDYIEIRRLKMRRLH